MTRTLGRLTVAAVASGALLAAGIAATTAFAGTTPTAARSSQQTHKSAQDAHPAILAAFDRYEVIAGAGPNDVYLNLIRNPEFAMRVDDIAVECGKSRYQPSLDRYTAGGDVALAQVRKVWRDTTQPSCGPAGRPSGRSPTAVVVDDQRRERGAATGSEMP